MNEQQFLTGTREFGALMDAIDRPATFAVMAMAAQHVFTLFPNLPVEETGRLSMLYVQGWEAAMTHAAEHPEHAMAWRQRLDAEQSGDLSRTLGKDLTPAEVRRHNAAEVAPFLELFSTGAGQPPAEGEEGEHVP